MSTAHVVIAVKGLAAAKSRLSDSFAENDRARLVVAMLRDTAAAAMAVPAVDSLTVVTPDPAVADIATALGAHVATDPSVSPTMSSVERLNSAFASAVSLVRATGGSDVIALQADLPALRTDELAQAYAQAPRGSRSVVSDHHGTGTAALILKDDDERFVPMFGPRSAQRHRDSGALDLAGNWPGLRLDVDTLEDVRLAHSLGVGPETTEVLRSLGW